MENHKSKKEVVLKKNIGGHTFKTYPVAIVIEAERYELEGRTLIYKHAKPRTQKQGHAK